MRLTYSLLLITTLLPAETPKLPEPYQSIVDLAQGAPPEFAADAMLRVAESGKIAALDARRDLLERAFRLAGSANFHIRMQSLPGSPADTRSIFLSKAYDLKLDALSLQSRAVGDMLAIDKPKARELFQQIARPTLAPLTCDDPLVYDVADFYQTLGRIVDGTFTDKERKKEEHLTFLLDYLGQATSPAQLAPLVRVIRNVGVTPEQRDILWNRLGGLLESIQPDDRSFSASFEELARTIAADAKTSFEKYQKKSTGCKDDQTSVINIDVSSLQSKPSDSGVTPKLVRYWESPGAQRLLQDGLQLRFDPNGRLFTDAERTSREWQQKLAGYLSELADWGPSEEKSEADYFHEKCVVYEALVELIPAGPQRDKTLQTFVDFIGNSNLQQQSPVEWFRHAHSMLERVRNTGNGEPSKVLDAFQSSGNPVLALYAAIEKALASNVPSWATPSN